MYSCSARIGVVFTPPFISLSALFCVVSRACRVELLAVISIITNFFSSKSNMTQLGWIISGNVLRVVRKKSFVEASVWYCWECTCKKELRHVARRDQ